MYFHKLNFKINNSKSQDTLYKFKKVVYTFLVLTSFRFFVLYDRSMQLLSKPLNPKNPSLQIWVSWKWNWSTLFFIIQNFQFYYTSINESIDLFVAVHLPRKDDTNNNKFQSKFQNSFCSITTVSRFSLYKVDQRSFWMARISTYDQCSILTKRLTSFHQFLYAKKLT